MPAAKGPRLPCRLPMRATQGATGVPPKDRLMAWLPSVDASRCYIHTMAHVDTGDQTARMTVWHQSGPDVYWTSPLMSASGGLLPHCDGLADSWANAKMVSMFVSMSESSSKGHEEPRDMELGNSA